LERNTSETISPETRLGLRYFWLHGLANAASDAFAVNFIPLFALAYGASTGQIGWLTAIANLVGALSLFPGARLVERVGRCKPVVIWSFGTTGRLSLLVLAALPWFGFKPIWAIVAIIGLNSLRVFMDYFASPAWTALVANLVPAAMRGRYFSSRNMIMGIAALILVPLAGWLINTANDWSASTWLGYQIVFFLAFAIGLLSTLSFHLIPEPAPAGHNRNSYRQGDLRRALQQSPGFLGLVISAFIWNMAIQVAAPFFNVYLVNQLQANISMVGILAGVNSLAALAGQQVFSRLLDRKGTIWVQQAAGLLIPCLPVFWIWVTAPWQVLFINAFGGFFWAGYNLANFNLLLELSPDEYRPRAVALYQSAVFGSAIFGPLIGGYLADLVSFQFIFGLSGFGRLMGILAFIWLAARPALRNGKGGSTPPLPLGSRLERRV
jgi:MFS family permease